MMISRKIEERNEKIVRGLLKLPPNRRCINCNSLGPQYVCTNFWTFICTACSGIHREFTHRVKSISMSKFTTQEVEAIQNGGNQRARELYLKGWDFQGQRLPDSSNVDRIREFIKNVYVDKKYVGKISDAPSTDPQSSQSHEGHIRASSYHSYSQSPPYDHQYEERKYGKRALVLSRKAGSEQSLYEGKVSSFMYSPTHTSEQACNDRFTNEGSISRYSLHSESSGGDPFRSENASPSSRSNHGFGGPSAQAAMECTTSTFLEENARRDVNKILHPQKTLSSESFGSFDRKSGSSDSYNSNSQVHIVLEHDQSAGEHHDDMLAAPSMEKHHSNGSSGTLDLFAEPVVPRPAVSSTVDLFQLPTISTSTVNLVQGSTFGTVLRTTPFQSSKTSPLSLDIFGGNSQDLLHVTNLEQSSSDMTMPKNEGWATFDTQPVPRSGLRFANAHQKSDNVCEGNPFSVSPLSEKRHHEPPQSEGMSQTQAHNVAAGLYPYVPSPWSDVIHHSQAFSSANTSQSWNAFEDPIGHTHWESLPHKIDPQFALNMPSPDTNQSMNLVVVEGPRGSATISSMSESVLPYSMYQYSSSEHNPDQQFTTKYTNPFDLLFDSDSDPNKLFLNVNFLGAALPSDSVQSSFPDEFTEPWLFQHPVTSFPTSTVLASIPCMAGQSPTSQFTDVSPHGPLASIGGNPFA